VYLHPLSSFVWTIESLKRAQSPHQNGKRKRFKAKESKEECLLR